jgi:hypothetical protein
LCRTPSCGIFFKKAWREKLSTEISKIKKTFCYTKANRSEWSQPDKLINNYSNASKKESKESCEESSEESCEEESTRIVLLSKALRHSPGCFLFP